MGHRNIFINKGIIIRRGIRRRRGEVGRGDRYEEKTEERIKGPIKAEKKGGPIALSVVVKKEKREERGRTVVRGSNIRVEEEKRRRILPNAF